MKKAIAVLASVCALLGGVYFAASNWAIRHETLNLFDAARQRPVAVDLHQHPVGERGQQTEEPDDRQEDKRRPQDHV